MDKTAEHPVKKEMASIMRLGMLECLSIKSANLPEFATRSCSEACKDCCCDVGCETYT